MLKNFQVIEVISFKSKSLMTVYKDKLKFNYQTAQELGYPPHVQLLIDPKGRCFAIKPCEKDDSNAVSFFNRGKETKPYPIKLSYPIAIDMIFNAMGWDGEGKYYAIQGQRFPDDNAIVYNLADADEYAITKRKGDSDDEDEN